MQILLDTNVLSEMMKDNPSPRCREWLAACSLDDLYFAATGEAELLAGKETTPIGKRRNQLGLQIEAWLQVFANGRMLPFDRRAAQEYAYVYAIRKKLGLGLDCTIDMQMSAIARANGMAVATRNVKDFDHVGLVIINPWDDVAGVREPRPSYGLAQAA